MAGKRRSSLISNGILLGASIVVTALLFGTLEGVLRLAGLGEPDASRTSRLKYQQIYFPTLIPDARPDGTEVLRTDDKRLPFQEILREKPANGYRVFTFGGSATAGLGYAPTVSFAHHLRQMLEAALPESHVEVVNLGIVALASKQVALLVDEAATHFDADALVVYSGNNEFLEIHAQKYADAHATPISRARELLAETHLYRFVNQAIRGGPDTPSLAEQDFSQEDLRLTQAAIIEDVKMEPAEIDAVVDRYAANIAAMQTSAEANDVPLLLMTVASNWEWRGRSDLPESWIDDLLGSVAPATPERLLEARRRVSEELEKAPANERYEWLYKRAELSAQLGDWGAARADYRAHMNEDPHLRRALDRMGDRVVAVAKAGAARAIDITAEFSQTTPNGIVGFEEFYDYVHFTPRGATRAGVLVFEALRDAGWLPEETDFAPQAYLQGEAARIAASGADAFGLDAWLGIGFDSANLSDRDLWKYDRMVKDLDQRLEANPQDLDALVYRGNAHYFEVDGHERAAALYERARDLAPENADIAENLDRVRSEARP